APRRGSHGLERPLRSAPEGGPRLRRRWGSSHPHPADHRAQKRPVEKAPQPLWRSPRRSGASAHNRSCSSLVSREDLLRLFDEGCACLGRVDKDALSSAVTEVGGGSRAEGRRELSFDASLEDTERGTLDRAEAPLSNR